MLKFQNDVSKKYFVVRIITDFISNLNGKLPPVIAFDFNGSEVLCWIEIESNDFEMEDNILTSEAKVNAKYHQYGFDMESMIVEASEKIAIPAHYSVLKS